MTLVVLVFVAPVLLLGVVFLAEVLAGLRRSAPTSAALAADSIVTIVIPAHNEEQVIGATLARLKSEATSNFAILVVADNCGDTTASISRHAGVQVAERCDSERRGKGFALAFARDFLRNAPPRAVIILDADCRMDRASLSALAASTIDNGRPSQAINLLEPAPTAGVLVQISTFAFLIKNLVRQRGLQRLAGGVHLTGTGMCLPWNDFDSADLATSSIVEDARLGLEFSNASKKPQLVEAATVWSAPAAEKDTLQQRSRWEGGLLSLARAEAPRMLSNAVRTLSPRKLFAALDLLVPPLAVLAMLYLAAVMVTGTFLALRLISPLPFTLLVASGLAISLGVLIAWYREGRTFLTLGAMLRLPLYLLWKIPLYLSLARRGAPTEWTRTRRSQADGSEGLDD